MKHTVPYHFLVLLLLPGLPLQLLLQLDKFSVSVLCGTRNPQLPGGYLALQSLESCLGLGLGWRQPRRTFSEGMTANHPEP